MAAKSKLPVGTMASVTGAGTEERGRRVRRETIISVEAGNHGVAVGRGVGINRGIAIVGDLIGGQVVQNIYQRSDFSEPNLEAVAAPDFESPEVTDGLVEVLLRRGLLLLGGHRFEGKETFARHVAWALRNRLENRDGVAGRLVIKQCFCAAGALKLEEELDQTKSRTLFLLQRAEIRHVGFSLEAVHKRVAAQGHFLLVTTEAARASWFQGRSSVPEEVWRELSSRDVYSVQYLGYELCKRLRTAEARGQSLPPGVFPDGRPGEWPGELEKPLVKGLSLRQVAERLDSPEVVWVLAEGIVRESKAVTAEDLLASVEQLQGDAAAVQSWYRCLAHREQLFVAGLLFFDGLFDDQLFGALDVAVAEAWRLREPGLESFDYQSLEGLGNYFRYDPTTRGSFRVESRSPAQADAMLRAVWSFHRRQLVCLLPVVSKLVREAGARAWRERRRKGSGETEFTRSVELQTSGSAEADDEAAAEVDSAESPTPASQPEPEAPEAADERPQDTASLSRWEAYGPAREIMSSPERRQRLFEVISRSLGWIGRLSVHSVERCLLELARDGSWEAQEVAAQALAYWFGTGAQEQFFSILSEWYGETAQLSPGGSGSDGFAHLRSTVSTAVFYVVFEEKPDCLHETIVDLIRKLADDRSGSVRVRFRDKTVPAAVALHARQLDIVMWNLVRYEDLIKPVAEGWSIAYSLRPEAADEQVEEWRRRCLALPPVPPSETASPREARLATVALTYGYIDYDHPELPLTPEEALGKLESLLREEHPFVRWHVLAAVRQLVSQRFGRVRDRLLKLIEKVSLADRPALVGALVEAYLVQRRELVGGQGSLEVDGVRYAVWLGDDRPQTDVELVLEAWMCDRSQPVAQQVAFEALVGCVGSRLDIAELNWRQRLRTDPSGAWGYHRPRPWQPRPPGPGLREAPATARFVLWLLTVGREDLRDQLAHVLPELLRALRRLAWPVQRLLHAWRRRPGQLGTVGRYLEKVAEIYRRRRAIVLTILVGGIVLSILLWKVFGQGE